MFAKKDKAFAKLPAGTLESLLKPENKVKLGGILTYHVVAGKVMAADVVKLTSAKTVNGQSVKVAVDGGKVRVEARMSSRRNWRKQWRYSRDRAVLLPK